MKYTFNPQFTVEQVYRMPFKEERVYQPDGTIKYVPLSSKEGTGIAFFDQLLEWCSYYCYHDIKALAYNAGLDMTQINGFVYLLTGMDARNFITKYKMRLVDDYLRYTNLSATKILEQCGIDSISTFTKRMQKVYKTNIRGRRQSLRQPNDVGRYR